MTEQVTQHDGNPGYVQQHPDAIQDPNKAEAMAYASKEQEEAFAAHKGAEQSMRYSAVDVGGVNQWKMIQAADQGNRAKTYRKAADSRQEIAGLAYDKGYDVEIKPLSKASNPNSVRQITP